MPVRSARTSLGALLDDLVEKHEFAAGLGDEVHVSLLRP